MPGRRVTKWHRNVWSYEPSIHVGMPQAELETASVSRRCEEQTFVQWVVELSIVLGLPRACGLFSSLCVIPFRGEGPCTFS